MSDVWVANAEAVISVALWRGREGVEQVWFHNALEGQHFPPQYVPIHDAVRELYTDGESITPETVLARMKGKGDLKKLRDIKTLMIGYAEAHASAEIMRDQAQYAADIEAFSRAIERRKKGASREEVFAELEHIRFAANGVKSQSTLIGDIYKRVASGEITLPEAIPTNIPWLDGILNGGLRVGQVIAVAGPEKSRKTSLTRNIALHAVRGHDDVAVGMMNYENDVFITTGDFMAMLAYEYLYLNGKHTKTTKSGRFYGDMCNGDYMMELAPRYHNGDMHGDLELAYSYAVAQVQQMRVHAYDVTDEYGGLDTIDDLELAFIKFKIENPDKRRIVIVDYAQLVESGSKDDKTLYANMRVFARRLPLFAQRYGCAVVALSQQNDEYKKDGDSTKTTGTKGGGDLPAAVTSFFETRYDADDPTAFYVKRIRARRGAAAGKTNNNGQAVKFGIHPASGLILGENGRPYEIAA